MKPLALMIVALAVCTPQRCVDYSSPPDRCPALPCVETGHVPCTSDADCAGSIGQACRPTTCQSACRPTSIAGACCDRNEDCASLICVFGAAPPGTCGPGGMLWDAGPP